VLRRLTPEHLLEVALRTRPYGVRRGGLSLKKLKEEVHGIDLGALEPCLPERLYSAARRITLAPPLFVGDLDRVRKKLDEASGLAAKGFDLQLIGRRQLRSNNSWMHN